MQTKVRDVKLQPLVACIGNAHDIGRQVGRNDGWGSGKARGFAGATALRAAVFSLAHVVCATFASHALDAARLDTPVASGSLEP